MTARITGPIQAVAETVQESKHGHGLRNTKQWRELLRYADATAASRSFAATARDGRVVTSAHTILQPGRAGTYECES